MKKPELKPCPFCGGEAEVVSHISFFDQLFFGVKCLYCGIQTSQYYREPTPAIKIWNTRTVPEEKTRRYDMTAEEAIKFMDTSISTDLFRTNVQTMPEKTTENVQEIDDMTPMDAWRIISANMQQLYKRRKAENPNPDWKGYTDAEIRAEVICFKALQEMQKKENESNAKTPTQKEKTAKTK